MTYNEAILRIMDHIAVHKIGQFPHYHIAEALKMAIEALEKQIPVDKSNTILTVCSCARQSVCPKCSNVIITNPNEYPKYCTWCGQALKWGDD